MNILVLHKMGDPKTWLSSVRDLEFCFSDNAPEHNYIVHNDMFPLPAYIQNIKFHGIILGPTFLCNRYISQDYEAALKKYEFIKNSNAFKIALPQDDYDCSAILEKWLIEWKIDIVYTVCPNNWEVLYPKLYNTGKLRLGYTAYISEKIIERSKKIKPLSERTIDVSYRSTKHNLGYVRYVKGIVGQLFCKYAQEYALKLDISVNDVFSPGKSKIISGDSWLDYIENSKFVLCSNSGSSILDPYGDYAKRLRDYFLLNPNAAYEDIEEACFPGEGNKWKFTPISPRNIEAALLETIQICVPGEYSGIMIPWEHYIPFEIDGSNFKQVIDTMKNEKKVNEIAAACKEKFLSINELRYSFHVAEIINTIYEGYKAKAVTCTFDENEKNLFTKYERELFLSTLINYRIRNCLGKFLLIFPNLHSFLKKVKRTINSFA